MANSLPKIVDLLKHHEGRVVNKDGRHVVYKCSAGQETIGYGRNVNRLHGRGISEKEAEAMLLEDIAEASRFLHKTFPWYADLTEARKAALVDMYHNLGPARLMKFLPTLELIGQGRYDEAADRFPNFAMWNQLQANKPGTQRPERIQKMIRTGRWPQDEHINLLDT